jgi:midasin
MIVLQFIIFAIFTGWIGYGIIQCLFKPQVKNIESQTDQINNEEESSSDEENNEMEEEEESSSDEENNEMEEEEDEVKNEDKEESSSDEEERGLYTNDEYSDFQKLPDVIKKQIIFNFLRNIRVCEENEVCNAEHKNEDECCSEVSNKEDEKSSKEENNEIPDSPDSFEMVEKPSMSLEDID